MGINRGAQDRVVARQRHRIASGCSSHIRVEPSMSVNKNVTVPVGRLTDRHYDLAWNRSSATAPARGPVVVGGRRGMVMCGVARSAEEYARSDGVLLNQARSV